MREKLSSALPKNLPTPRDRMPVYELYDSLGFFEDAGWTKIKLFDQYVRNTRGELVTGPVYAFASSDQPVEEAVWIVAGVHGYKEPAPSKAVATETETLIQLGKEIPMVVIGLLNLGYVNNTRYGLDQFGRPTFLSLCDFDHLVLDHRLKNRVRTRRETPSNMYAKVLGEKFLELLNIYHAILFFDFHEDWTNTATHVYSDGILTYDDPVSKMCLEIFQAAGVPIRMETPAVSIERTYEETRGGICHLENGSLENLVTAFFIRDPDNPNRIIAGPGVPVCITTETLIKHNGQHFSLDSRVTTQAKILRQIEAFVDRIHDNDNLYKEKSAIERERLRQKITKSGLILA